MKRMRLLKHKKSCLDLREKKSRLLKRTSPMKRRKTRWLWTQSKSRMALSLSWKSHSLVKKEKVDDLTRKFSFVNDTNTFLRKDNEKLQESITSLQANHTALEVQFNTLWESTSKTKESSNSSSPSTSMDVHGALILIFKLVLLTMLRWMQWRKKSLDSLTYCRRGSITYSSPQENSLYKGRWVWETHKVIWVKIHEQV